MTFSIVSLIGRKNVGKSTLFNRLTCTRDALVGSDLTGLTRDRRYGSLKWKGYQAIIVDTGGIDRITSEIDSCVCDQSIYAILEANLILFVVDGQSGLMPFDREIMHRLYKFQKSVFIVVNKIDNFHLDNLRFEFYSLGVKKVIFVSAIHGHGIDILSEEIFLKFYRNESIPKKKNFDRSMQLKMFLRNPSYFLRGKDSKIIRLAVVGAPNVGKSTFINYVLGENRMLVSQLPGTTRDSICVSMIYHGRQWIIIDTAGIRKRNKMSSIAEEVSIMGTLKAIQSVTVVLLLINAHCGISAYDLSLLNNVLRIGKSLVIGVNKWDLLSNDAQKEFKITCNARIHFIPFVIKHFISGLSGDGVHCLLKSIIKVHYSSFKLVSTACLTRIMHMAVNKHPPPRVYGKQVKLKYAHIGGHVPFIIVVHGHHVIELPDHYKRYLDKYFLKFLKMSGVSICIQFKEERR